MRTSVIISLWNYGDFIEECLNGVLQQSAPVDEIIIVDDGSTDDGVEKVQKLAVKHPKVTVIQQENLGQLAAFQRGIEHSTGDLVFFLDADDVWTPEHVERSCIIFEEMPEVDFVYTGYQEFGRSERKVCPHDKNIHLGRSILITRFNRNYIGSITSTNAIRRSLLKDLFPVPDEKLEHSRINADAYLVFGSSLAGGTKYYRSDPTVQYRIHTKNNYQGRRYSSGQRYGQIIEQWQTIEYLWDRLELPESLCTELAREFKTIQRPDRRCYKRAIQTLSKLPLPLTYRIQCRIELFRHYYKSRKGS